MILRLKKNGDREGNVNRRRNLNQTGRDDKKRCYILPISTKGTNWTDFLLQPLHQNFARHLL